MIKIKMKIMIKSQWDTIAIVGVGLIGGSIGLALRKRGIARRVVGVGRREASLDEALRLGAVDATSTDMHVGVAEAELTVVCTPVERIVEHAQQAAAACAEGAIITDAGSTKGAIVAALDSSLPRGVRFVGSHPLAGSEKTGCASARSDLFNDRVAVVTPGDGTTDSDCAAIESFWKALGMKTIRMSPADHDAALASTSHLPHVVASALAAATDEKNLPLVASGWLDTTRIAAADAELWRQIFLDNRENTLRAIAEFEGSLAAMKAAIEAGDAERLEELLRVAKQRRDRGDAP